jgi:hypothetical protein
MDEPRQLGNVFAREVYSSQRYRIFSQYCMGKGDRVSEAEPLDSALLQADRFSAQV